MFLVIIFLYLKISINKINLVNLDKANPKYLISISLKLIIIW